MYTPETIQTYVEAAKQFLQAAAGLHHVDTLRDIINYADWAYYVQDNPVLADTEYDILFAQLKQIEKDNPEIISADSPTQRVANGLNQQFPTVAHWVPMLSLENSYEANDLLEWDRRCKELANTQQITYCVEPKFDGASISLVYENDLLVMGATRGNGIAGDDITPNTKQIRSIPLKAAFSDVGIQMVEIRGEVVMTKDKFLAYNRQLAERQIAPLANARNAASGSLRIKDPQEVAKRNLDAFLYNISFMQRSSGSELSASLQTHSGILQTLQDLGFKTAGQLVQVCSSIEAVIAYVQDFETKRDTLPYDIDGMVIKVNDMHLHDVIGQTSHHPRWAMAYKFKARQASSILLDIEYQVGRTGSITPVAKIEPVSVGGVTISSISLFNEDVIREKDLRLGDTILVERAGDVIPYIVKSFPELRKGSERVIQFPVLCPVCNQILHKPEGEAVARCVNNECSAQVVERMIHFCSKDAMDIRGLGDALIRKFYEAGLLLHIVGIYHLPFDKIKTMEGFGDKSMLNLQAAIEKSKTQPLHRLIFGLGIRYVGETTAKALARTITHINELYNKTADELKQIDDVGEKVAASIVEFFTHIPNRSLLDDLEKAGVSLVNTQKAAMAEGGNLQGKSFLFTGTLSMKRSEAEALAESKGATILNSVSSKLHYLVVGEDAGSKLDKAKKLGTINILTEAEFIQLIQSQ